MMGQNYHADGSIPAEDQAFIWVFGSNLAGYHGGCGWAAGQRGAVSVCLCVLARDAAFARRM